MPGYCDYSAVWQTASSYRSLFNNFTYLLQFRTFSAVYGIEYAICLRAAAAADAAGIYRASSQGLRCLT